MYWQIKGVQRAGLRRVGGRTDIKLWQADHTSNWESERHRYRSRFGSIGGDSRKRTKEHDEMKDRSATENVMTEIAAQRKLNKSRGLEERLRESVEWWEAEGHSIFWASGRYEKGRGAGEKRRMKRTDIAAEWRTEKPQEKRRGQTKRTWLRQVVASICDQEGDQIKIWMQIFCSSLLP